MVSERKKERIDTIKEARFFLKQIKALEQENARLEETLEKAQKEIKNFASVYVELERCKAWMGKSVKALENCIKEYSRETRDAAKQVLDDPIVKRMLDDS